MADRPATTSKIKNPGRKRRVAGWLLLVIGVLITGVWGASRWWWFGYTGPMWEIDVIRGKVGVTVCTDRGQANAMGWFGGHANAGAYGRVLIGFAQGWDLWLPVVRQGQEEGVTVWASAGIVSAYSMTLPGSGPDRVWLASVLLWPFALVSLLGGGWLVWSGRRARRRAMTGVCLKCGYDLAGLAAGAPCPECGEAESSGRLT